MTPDPKTVGHIPMSVGKKEKDDNYLIIKAIDSFFMQHLNDMLAHDLWL